MTYFAGAGGLSLGFCKAGFEPKLAVDNDPAAIRTYAANIGNHALLTDITENIELPTASVIVGGPPCQGFSSAGLRKKGDKRNSLVGCFARIVARMRPPAFVFENVEGFLTAEKGARVIDFLGPLIDAGYLIHLRKVNVANYGVAQHRKRIIAIGGLGWESNFPKPQTSAYGAPGAYLVGYDLPPTPTVADALQDLSPASPIEANNSKVTDHVYRPLTGIALERVRTLKPGNTMRDLPEDLRHTSYQRRAYRRVQDGTPTEQRGGAPAGIRRLRPDHPSKAITGGARTEFVHPKEHRFLTLRECARIQTFPDNFILQGTITQKAVLIGNAIPPAFATVIGHTLAEELHTTTTKSVEGTLLSFVPTSSKGFSPALKRTCEIVLSHLPHKSSQIELPI